MTFKRPVQYSGTGVIDADRNIVCHCYDEHTAVAIAGALNYVPPAPDSQADIRGPQQGGYPFAAPSAASGLEDVEDEIVQCWAKGFALDKITDWENVADALEELARKYARSHQAPVGEERPTVIEGPLPGEAVERARLAGDYSAVPGLVEPPRPSKKPLEERLQLAAYACKVAHLLGPQAAIVDALAELRAYNELVLAVGNKYPGESRYETALRYIRNAERPAQGECVAKLKQGKS